MSSANEVSEITRREIIDRLLMDDVPFHGRLEIIEFLKRVWNLGTMASTDHRFKTAEQDVWQHMVNNLDWGDDYLLNTYLELAKCDDALFLRFLENCVHPRAVEPDKAKSRVDEWNPLLARDGYQLVPRDHISGRPVYAAVRTEPCTSSLESPTPSDDRATSIPSVDQLPYDIIEAMVQCFGKSFHYKDPLEQFLRSAGVSRELAARYRHEAKFPWSRHVLAELGESEDGRLVQRRLLTELCKLRDLPDADVKDRDAGIAALRRLKELAVTNSLYVQEQKQQADDRARRAAASVNVVQERAGKLEHLKQQFSAGLADTNRQRAGYSLEDLFKELCGLYEIEYRKSYRTNTQQIDGCFRFEGFDYLVEARWRADQPTTEEIGGFKAKVDSKIESTRGLFISIQDFRREVIRDFEGRGANIIFMSGEDLVYVLEGRFDLRDAIRLKVEKAAQEGKAFVPLREHM